MISSKSDVTSVTAVGFSKAGWTCGYLAALEGGDNGPNIVPGDSEATGSLRVLLADEGHFGWLTGEPLAAILQWIEEGAKE